ncbi:MAG: RNA polymerase Rpb4 family protein [Candidatus Micrarchaeia archaeon]
MIGKNLNSSKQVTVAAAKEILKARSKDGDLLYEQAGSLSYCEKFAKIPEKDAQKIVDELVGMGIGEESAIKVADIIPKYKSQLAAILSRESPEVPQDKQDKIFDMLAPYQERAQEHSKKMAELKQQEEAAKAQAEAAAKEAEEKAANAAEEEEKAKEEEKAEPAAKPKKEKKAKKEKA